MSKLNQALLLEVKQAFIPQPGQDPAAAGGAPMDPAMAGGAPMYPAMAGGGAPMDPAMAGGGAPMDPAMAGAAPAGMPPPGLDPAMAGMMGGAPGGSGMTGSSQLTLTVDDLIKLFKVFQKNSGGGDMGGGAPAAAPAPQAPPQDPRVDKILEMLTQAGLGGVEGGQ